MDGTITGNHPAKLCVLILEDDGVLLSILQSEIEAKNYTVLCASGERELRALLVEPQFDIVVLDLGLDDKPYKGLDLVQEIRNARNVPIVVISGHHQPWDRLRALEMGVDDYVTKPFHLGELLIRIGRVCKLYDVKGADERTGGPVFVFSGMCLDTVRRTLRASNGGLVDLTESEFDILKALVFGAGRILTRDELWRAVRGESSTPSGRALDGHVARLRAKLETGEERPQLIKSVRGIGYVLAAPVSSVPSPETS